MSRIKHGIDISLIWLLLIVCWCSSYPMVLSLSTKDIAEAKNGSTPQFDDITQHVIVGNYSNMPKIRKITETSLPALSPEHKTIMEASTFNSTPVSIVTTKPKTILSTTTLSPTPKIAKTELKQVAENAFIKTPVKLDKYIITKVVNSSMESDLNVRNISIAAGIKPTTENITTSTINKTKSDTVSTASMNFESKLIGNESKVAFSNHTTTQAANQTINSTSTIAEINSNSKMVRNTTAVQVSTTTPAINTTTTTAVKPKKPLVTYGVEDFPDLDEHRGEQIVGMKSMGTSASIAEAPYAQPSQEFANSNPFPSDNHSYISPRRYTVPIVSLIFFAPLAIGIFVTIYRRFRDCWSTRHYRRMDFLVDGMYD